MPSVSMAWRSIALISSVVATFISYLVPLDLILFFRRNSAAGLCTQKVGR